MLKEKTPVNPHIWLTITFLGIATWSVPLMILVETMDQRWEKPLYRTSALGILILAAGLTGYLLSSP